MYRLFLLLALVLALGFLGSKPQAEIVVTSERFSCGYECDQNDGVLSSDENITWVAEGTLGRGESYTYSWQPNSGSRRISARTLSHGKPLLFDIYIESGPHSADGVGEVCLSYIGNRNDVLPWSVTITNNTKKRNQKWVYFNGVNRFGGYC